MKERLKTTAMGNGKENCLWDKPEVRSIQGLAELTCGELHDFLSQAYQVRSRGESNCLHGSGSEIGRKVDREAKG